MVQYYAAAYSHSPAAERRMIRSENGLGVAGFIISILGLLTCGVLSPVALLLSFIGLLRRPRGFAIAGTVLGLIGTTLIGGVVAIIVLAAQEASLAVERARDEAVTQSAIATAEADLHRQIAESGALPEGIEGNKVAIRHSDAWGNSLRYDLRQDGFAVRSAGPDGVFETPDDLTSSSGSPLAPPAETLPADAPAEQLIPLE